MATIDIRFTPNGPGLCNCARCHQRLSTNAFAKNAHISRCPGKPGLIDFAKFPKYFTRDSIERGIFEPEQDRWATPDQIRALLSDAEFYSDRWGPDQCPPGLIPSARAVVKHCKAALAGGRS